MRQLIRIAAAVGAALGIAGCAGSYGAARATDRDDAQRDAQRAARDAVAQERTLDPASFPPRSVTVVPLELAVTDTSLGPLGYGLADLLLTDLAQSRQLVVVERLRVDAVLRELHLASTGLVDRTTAPRIGRLVGARRLVLGRISPRRGGELAVEVTVADATTGRLAPLPAAAVRPADVIEAEKVLAFRLFDHLGVTLSPSERAAVEQRPTRSLAALLAYGRAVRYELLGDYANAVRAYEDAERRDPGFRRAAERRRAIDPLARPVTRSVSSLTRAGAAAADRINGVFGTPIGGAARPGSPADPALLASTATIFITITTPP